MWLGSGLLVALVVAWFLLSFHRESRTVDLPPRGEAGFNPLYALKIALREDGQTVVSRQRLSLDSVALGRRDTVVLNGDPRTLSAHDLDRLFAFVENGGHLILQLPEWAEASKASAAQDLSEHLPIRPALVEPDCMRLRWPGDEHDALQFCGDPRFALKDAPKLLARWQDARGGYVYARFPVGEGSVDLLSSFEMLDNRGMQTPRNVPFVRQLLAPNWNAGSVHLVYSADVPPLWRWLLEHGWRALLPAFLGLLLWLWLRAQRFGPLLPAPLKPRRALLEHVEASGEHLLRYGQLGVLHRALLGNVQERLRRRDPLAAAQEGDTQASLIAARSGLPAAEVRAALDTRPPRDPHDFRHRIARLLELRKRL